MRTRHTVSTMLSLVPIWRLERPPISHLLVLLPLLHVPLGVLVATWERLSRSARSDAVESAAFCSALVGTFVALLLPAG